MGRKLELTGQRFGRLVALRTAGKRGGAYVWECSCDCGRTVSVLAASLRRGVTKSCGCLNRELAGKRVAEYNTKHGECYTRLNSIWRKMRGRCSNKNLPAYADYGGRGISVCAEWQASYTAFRDWAVANGYRDDLSLDRIDVDGNYEPDNCRWADRKMQANNTRKNVHICFNGEEHTIAEWAKIIGVSTGTLWLRINRYHWPIERALTTGGATK